MCRKESGSCLSLGRRITFFPECQIISDRSDGRAAFDLPMDSRSVPTLDFGDRGASNVGFARSGGAGWYVVVVVCDLGRRLGSKWKGNWCRSVLRETRGQRVYGKEGGVWRREVDIRQWGHD